METIITDQDYADEDEVFTSWFTCPNCDSSFVAIIFKFCPHCGTKITWHLEDKYNHNSQKYN